MPATKTKKSPKKRSVRCSSTSHFRPQCKRPIHVLSGRAHVSTPDCSGLALDRHLYVQVEAAIGRPLEDEEVQEEEEGKTATFEEWVEQFCMSMTFIPRKGDKTLTCK